VPIAKILVPLVGTPRDIDALGCAFAAAKLFSAHVEALFVHPDPVEAMPLYGEGMSSAVVREIMVLTRNSADSACRTALANCEALSKEGRIEIVNRPMKRDYPTMSFRQVEGNFSAQVARAARLADLVVFGPVREDEQPGLGDAFDATLVETGRPVLLASGDTAADFASRIALAWNASTASTHAITAALPFLRIAKSVEILMVKSSESSSIEELQQYLALHGIVATQRVVDGHSPVADVLVDAAQSGGNGMLVAGGYGHSRMRELFVSGVTRRVVARAGIPCFLVH